MYYDYDSLMQRALSLQNSFRDLKFQIFRSKYIKFGTAKNVQYLLEHFPYLIASGQVSPQISFKFCQKNVKGLSASFFRQSFQIMSHFVS